MKISFEHEPHKHITDRKPPEPPPLDDAPKNFNDKFAVLLTNAVGTMWCAYAFAILSLLVVKDAFKGGLLTFIQWVSQTFIQLVMLSVIMVGQNIMSKSSDKRADLTYKDADATFHEAKQIQMHLKEQDNALNDMIDRLEKLEAQIIREKNAGTA